MKITLIILSFLFLQACTSQMQSVFDSDKNSINLSLETKSSGDGIKYDNEIDLDIEDTLTIYSILRDADGEFLENVEVSWALGEGVGELLILNQGKSATFSSDSLGTNTIKVFKDNVLVKTYTLNVKVLVPRTLTVESVYSLNGDWNDYVKNDEPGKDWYSQDNVTCVGDENGYHSSCIHGGEKKKVEITIEPSCDGLSIKEKLDAFNWICDDSQGHVVFYTQGLKENKGLKNLVTANDWKENDVVIHEDGKAKHKSTLAKWWNNDVIPLPENVANDTVESLATEGAVYTLESTRTSSGYRFDADRISIVTLNDAILKYDGHSTSNNLVSTNSHDFIWLEGNYSTYPSSGASDRTFSVYGGQFQTVRNVNSDGSIFTRYMQTSRFIRLRISRSADYGIYTMYSNDGPVFYDIIISNTQNTGFQVHRNSAYLVNVLVVNTDSHGFSGGGDGTFHHIGAINNSTIGFQMWAGNIATLSHVLMMNNSSRSFGVFDATSNINFSQVALDNLYIGGSSTNIFFQDNAVFTSCEVTSSGSFPGLTESPANSCSNHGDSTAVIQNLTTLTNSIVAKIDSDDSVNNTDSSGVASYDNDPSNFDWFNFESRYRAWGKDGANFPDGSNLGPCTTGTCRIWDFRLLATDSLLLNQSSNSLSSNENFLPGMPCPQAVDGSVVITNNTTRNPQSTYLVNATEVMEDSIGNENGLCESNEACIYSPNIGPYQGEGDFKSNGTCAFQDGTVSGVTMYAYPQNGI